MLAIGRDKVGVSAKLGSKTSSRLFPLIPLADGTGIRLSSDIQATACMKPKVQFCGVWKKHDSLLSYHLQHHHPVNHQVKYLAEADPPNLSCLMTCQACLGDLKEPFAWQSIESVEMAIAAELPQPCELAELPEQDETTGMGEIARCIMVEAAQGWLAELAEWVEPAWLSETGKTVAVTELSG